MPKSWMPFGKWACNVDFKNLPSDTKIRCFHCRQLFTRDKAIEVTMKDGIVLYYCPYSGCDGDLTDFFIVKK
jgi:hypothetical protein